MPTDAELRVIIKAKDEMSAVAKKATGAIAGLAGTAVLIKGLQTAFKALSDSVQQAARVEGLRTAFEGVADSAEDMLAQLRKGSMGMVEDAKLMENYNLAAQLVSKTFADQLPQAMQYLSKVASATGQDMDYMMNSLVRGVGRLSPMILDNLAIQVDLSESYEAYADSIGKSVDELTREEQQTAVMNQVMIKLAQNTAAMPDVTDTAAASFASLRTVMANLRTQIDKAFLPIAKSLTSKLSEIAQTVGPAVISTVQKMTRYITDLSPAAKTAAAVIAGIATAVVGLSGAIAAFNLLMAANPIGLAVIGITAAALGLVAVVDKINQAVKESYTTTALSQDQVLAYRMEGEALNALNGTYEEYVAAKIAAERVRGVEVTQEMLLANRLIVTREQYEQYFGVQARLIRQSAILEQANDVVGAAMRDVARAAQEEQIADSALLETWNNLPAMAAQSAAAVREQMSIIGKSVRAAFDSDAMIDQLVKNQQAFAAHGQEMVRLSEDYNRNLAEMEFQYLLSRAQAEQTYQQEHAALLSAGRDKDAADLLSKFTRERGLAEAQYQLDRQLQQRSYILQQIDRLRAYSQELVEMRDQTLRTLQEQVKAEAAKRGISQAAMNQMLRDIAASGSAALQLETAAYIARADAYTEFWKGNVTATGAAVQAIQAIVAQQTTAEDAATALERQLAGLENELLNNLPALPPIDTSAWDTSLSHATESATTTLSQLVSDVDQAVTEALDAIEKLLDFEVPAGVDVGLARLADFIKVAVTALYATFDDIKPQVTAMKDTIGPLNELLRLIGSGIDAMSELAKYESAENLPALAATLADDMAKTGTAFRDVFINWDKTIEGDSAKAAGEWWTKVAVLVGFVGNGVQAMAALAEYEPVKNLYGKVSTLANDMAKVATAYRDVFVNWDKTINGNSAEAASKWWDQTAKLSTYVKGGVDAMSALSAYAPVKNLYRQVTALASDMAKTATALRDAFVNWKDTINVDSASGAAGWWEATSKLVAYVRGGVEAMSALGDYKPVKDLYRKVTVLASDMAKTATALRDVFVRWRGTTNLQQDALDWWERVTDVAGNVKGGVDAMTALAGYKPVKNLVAKIAGLASDMAKVATALRDVFVRWRGTINLKQEAVDWWAQVSDIVGVVKPGIDALASVAEYRPMRNLAAKIAGFASDIAGVAGQLVVAFNTWGGTVKIKQKALDWWTNVGDIVGVIQPGINALKALAQYANVKDLGAKTAAFIEGMRTMVVKLVEAMSAEGMPSLKVAKRAGEYFSAVVEIVGAVTPASEAINRIVGASIVDLKTLQTRFPKFQENMLYVVRAMAGMVDALRAAGIERARTFGDKMQAISDALEAGLGAFDNIKNRAAGGDAHNAMEVLWNFVRDANAALASVVDVVKAQLYNMEQAFIVRIPLAYAAGYAYGQALANGVNAGFASMDLPRPGTAGQVAAPRTGGVGLGNVTINLVGATIRDEQDAARLAAKIGLVVREQMRR